MPRRAPFTTLCQSLARPTPRRQADLHVHTTHSDGTASPAELLDAVRRAGLRAVAITDHDTLSGYEAAEALPKPPTGGWPALLIVPGVEITSSLHYREVHLLAYDVRPDDPALSEALAGLRLARVERFREMAERLRRVGVSVDEEAVSRLIAGSSAAHALGRRHLAALLVNAGRVKTVREAFERYLRDGGPASAPKQRLPVETAILLAHGAGGVTSLAHPPADWQQERFAELAEMGLDAVEVDFPACRPTRSGQLRDWAASLGLAASGGSDWHGPSQTGKNVGMCGVSLDDLALLRSRACSVDCSRS